MNRQSRKGAVLAVTALSRVLIVDDHPMFRDALKTAIKQSFPDSESVEVPCIDDALNEIETRDDIDLALLDLHLPGVQGFDGLIRLRSNYPRLPVLIVSGLEKETIIGEAMTFGAAGFVPKSAGCKVLADAITTVLDGGLYTPDAANNGSGDGVDPEIALLLERVSSLTPQQMRVLFMVREGLLNKQIAYELNVGATTIKKHVSEILRKLKVHSRTQAVIELSKLNQQTLFELDQQFIAEREQQLSESSQRSAL